MAAEKYDILIEQGANFQLNLQLLQSDGITPIVLTGNTFTAEIRDNYSEEDPPIATIACTIIDAINGKVQLNMNAATTSAIPVTPASDGTLQLTEYLWDLKRVDNAGFVSRVLQGFANVSPEITD